MNCEQKQSVLVVDDTLENIDVLKGILQNYYTVRVAKGGEYAIKQAAKNPPDIILLDIMMPEIDGYEVCRHLKANPTTANIPIIFVTAMNESCDEEAGFALGAVDYITKPVNPPIVLARVEAQLKLADQRKACEREVAIRTEELRASQQAAIYMLGEAGHYNDTDTGLHIWRMAAYAGALARACLWPDAKAKLLELAAPMHDTGKIGIPDEILKAPRKLTEEEWVTMRTHAEIGHSILSKSEAPLFKLAAEIALSHHEKWDGSGYPQGLAGNDIPESARIVAIADVFDALTMRRPYKEPWSFEKAFSLLKEESGRHFDPHLVKLFVEMEDEIRELKALWEMREEQGLNICENGTPKQEGT